MKLPSFTFVETFPLVATAIVNSCHGSNRFVSRDEIAQWLLNDPYSSKLVEDARRKRGRKKSLQFLAGNMVDWFSMRWTMEDPTWVGLFVKFKRERSGGHWCYKPRGRVSGVEVIREGAMVQVFVNTYERDRHARDECIQKYGTDCYVCGFSFRAAYGEIADGIVHVHHLRPLAEIGKQYKVDPIADLRPVCPNCHAVLHWRIPAYSIEEVKALLRRGKAHGAKQRHSKNSS
jgi:hypothetical protein